MTQPYIVIIDYQVLPRITHCAFMGLSGRWGCFPASRGACEGYVAQCPMAVVSVGKRNSAAPVQSRRTSLQCAFALDQLVAPQNMIHLLATGDFTTLARGVRVGVSIILSTGVFFGLKEKYYTFLNSLINYMELFI